MARYDIAAETVYMATDKETRLTRLRARACAHEDDFILHPSLAARYFDHFEVPTDEEGPLTVHP